MGNKMNMDKQSVKNERVKSYFVQAAKEIIMRDGVESVSVRKVADLAGYSYATIYNYFADLNALLLEVKTAMIWDIIAYMSGIQRENICGINDIKKLNRRYLDYYLEHPHVFRFFYSYRLNSEPGAAAALPFDFTSRWHDTYKGLVISGTIRDSDVEIIAKTIIYAMHGMLALFFSDNSLTQELLYSELDKVTEYVLKGEENNA